MSKRKAEQRRVRRALEWRRTWRRTPLALRRWRWVVEIQTPAFAIIASQFAAALGVGRCSDGEQA